MSAIEFEAASFGSLAFCGSTFEPGFHLDQSAGEELSSFNNRNTSNFEIAAPRTNFGRLLFKTSARLGHASGRRGKFIVGVFEIGKHPLEFGDTCIFTSHTVGELAKMIAECFGFGGRIATVGLGSLQTVTGCSESGIVCVEIASKTSFNACGFGQFGSCRFEHARRFSRNEHCFVGTASCFVERGTSCTSTR